MSRRRLLARGSIRARLVAMTAVLVVVIAGIIDLSARSTSVDHERVLVNNVAGRQPVLVERYLSEVLLESSGVTADPAQTADALTHNAEALLNGGAVLAVQGNDATIYIPRQTDPTVRAKLAAFQTLAADLVAVGDKLAAEQPSDPTYRADVTRAVDLSHVTANVGHDAVGRMTVLADRDVRNHAREEILLAGTGIAVALGLCVLLSTSIVRRLRALAVTARANAAGDLTRRSDIDGTDEIATLASTFNDMAENLSQLFGRLESEAARDGFGTRLTEALEMADEEADAYDVVARAMGEISASMPAELLIADSSHAHLQCLASTPDVARPACPVDSPFGCVAVRRGRATVFETSEALNACPHLRDRPGGPCSAVCVPVTFMGKAVGVLHATGPAGRPPAADHVAQLSTLAASAGSRIGTVRAFHQSQLQASTDGLTGLINRRTLENELRRLLRAGTPFAVAVADLDHFKLLNDTYGHEGGDRALRLFARTVRDALRTGDVVARYGGEEFVLVFPGVDAARAVELVDRLRVTLAGALEASDGPTFTASFGVADTGNGDTLDEVLRAADEALMVAKAEGRNRVVLATTRG